MSHPVPAPIRAISLLTSRSSSAASTRWVCTRAAKESEIPNFKGSYLGRFPLVSADFWTSDRLSERSRSVDAFLRNARARNTHVEATLNHPFAAQVRPAVAVADFLCGDARAIEVRVFAEHFLLGSFLHRKLASALGLLGARVTTFCTRLSAFASTYVAARPRVDFDGVLAKNKTTLSKRACAAVLRCDKRHRY